MGANRGGPGARTRRGAQRSAGRWRGLRGHQGPVPASVPLLSAAASAGPGRAGPEPPGMGSRALLSQRFCLSC